MTRLVSSRRVGTGLLCWQVSALLIFGHVVCGYIPELGLPAAICLLAGLLLAVVGSQQIHRGLEGNPGRKVALVTALLDLAAAIVLCVLLAIDLPSLMQQLPQVYWLNIPLALHTAALAAFMLLLTEVGLAANYPASRNRASRSMGLFVVLAILLVIGGAIIPVYLPGVVAGAQLFLMLILVTPIRRAIVKYRAGG